MAFQYQTIQEELLLSIKLVDANGDPVTGDTVTVTIEDASDATKLLTDQAMTEIGTSGIYDYSWTHGLSQRTYLYATFEVDDGSTTQFIVEDYTIDNLEKGLDEREAVAI
jgi:hypothetical protein